MSGALVRIVPPVIPGDLFATAKPMFFWAADGRGARVRVSQGVYLVCSVTNNDSTIGGHVLLLGHNGMFHVIFSRE